MGVQGLWELLAPVGRRVSVESLSGRKLAIDASIWIIQFMKAMRDEKGDMIRNAHILGCFRRICKLLYLRAKPVFVFNGGTPALKRRTVIARRRQRERAQSKIRKTAEKLLLNHLRTRKLDEIAQNIGLEQSMKKQENLNIELVESNNKGEKLTRLNGNSEKENTRNKEKETDEQDGNQRQPPLVLPEPSMTDIGKWTAPSVSKADEDFITADGGEVDDESDNSDGGEEEYFMPPAQGRVDPAVLASLPPSMQLNLLVQMREQLVTDNRKKFQKVAKNPSSFSQMQIQAYLKTVAFRRDINQVQKAAAGKGIGGIPSARIASEADREYIFSTSFQPESQATEAGEEDTHEDNQPVHGSKYSQEGPQSIDADKNTTITEVSLQKASPKDNSLEDQDIEWEDGDEMVSLQSQPVKGAVITIEIDQNGVVAEGLGGQQLCPDFGLEDEDIEWEDGAMECINTVEQLGVPLNNGESMVDSDIGTGLPASGELSAPSPEIVDNTLMEIEAAELEEAIRQSLADHTGHKASMLVIRDESAMELKENESLPLDYSVPEASLSEEAFLARERERKGKAVVDDYQGVYSGSRVTVEAATFTLKANDLDQVCGIEDAKRCKPEILDSVTVFPSKAHNMDLIVDSLHSESGKRFTSITDNAAPSDEHTSVDCDAMSPLNNVPKPENECEVEVDANIGHGVEVSNMSDVHNERASLSPLPPKTEEVGVEIHRLEEIMQANRVFQPIIDQEKVVHTNSAAIVDGEKSSALPRHFTGDVVRGNDNAAEDNPMEDALLKEAEEVDLTAEREAFAMQERSLLAEREELSRQQAELQAEIEAEQAAMQTDLQEERDVLLQEEMELRASQRKNERNAESVTGEMFSECQELLQMFGLPYIIAPMEAEAQCAHMDSIGLVDGVVTEDCDTFLFGGRNVFKNIFDDRKYVETYYMKDVESELGLDQEKLIHMALLLGSDYTEGISGIGIVNAIEVVNAFEGEEGLQKFKDWLDAPDLTLLSKVHQDGRKKQMRKNRGERESEAEDKNVTEEAVDFANYDHRQQDFMFKHRAVSKNWNVPENFPSPLVINAYVSPQVDRSTESFTWGRPDLEALRRLCLERFGWNKSKSDELLLPVLKEYDRHETQLRLEAFYTFNQRFAKIRSKRIQKAVTRGTGRRLSSELVDLPSGDASEESSPMGTATNSKQQNACREPDPPIKEGLNGAAGSKRKKKGALQGGLHGEEVASKMATRGRGRGRGRTASSRGRATSSKRSHSELPTEASASDGSSSEELLDLDDKGRKDEVHLTVPRRSNRLPERAVYTFSGSEDDSDTVLDASVEAGGSPGHERVFPPSKVEVSEKHVMPRDGEASHNQDGKIKTQEEASVDAIGHQYELQGGGKDEQYLITGGGFCMVDDDDDDRSQDQSMAGLESLPAEKEGSDVVVEGSACPVTPLVGSEFLPKAELTRSENAGDLTRAEEPRLHAMPNLRRKKRRSS